MANPKHVEILHQGVEVWNQWRLKNPQIIPNLSYEYFANYKLGLNGVNFREATLHESKFQGVVLTKADFSHARLYGSFFDKCVFSTINFYHAFLVNSDFSYTRLTDVNFELTNLGGVSLKNLSHVKANFSLSKLGSTIFSACDLREAIGLEKATHYRPSTIGIDTIYLSGGKIPEIFLKKAGIPEVFITYAHSLLGKPIDFYSCFISFTEKDDAFSERLYNDMQAKGVRCWRWKEDAKWGRTLRKEIDEAVRYYDKLVVICSKDSLKAPAVLEEIERALDKEDALKRAGDEGEVLFPIRIDDYIFDGWESELKVRLTKKHIGDFRDWNGDPEKYRRSVERLVKDLNRPKK